MKKKNFTKKKPTKKSSKKKNKKKNKKLLKSTENAIKKKMAPTKKTKYVEVEDSEGNHKTEPEDLDDIVSGISSVEDGVNSANDLADDMSNGIKPSDDDLDSLATGKKAK